MKVSQQSCQATSEFRQQLTYIADSGNVHIPRNAGCCRELSTDVIKLDERPGSDLSSTHGRDLNELFTCNFKPNYDTKYTAYCKREYCTSAITKSKYTYL